MDIATTREKLHAALDSVGMNEEMKQILAYFYEQLLNEHITILIENVIPPEQAEDLAFQAAEEGMDEKDVIVAMWELYKIKTGKDIQDEINDYTVNFSDSIVSMNTQMKSRMEEIMKLPEEERLDALSNDILKDVKETKDE